MKRILHLPVIAAVLLTTGSATAQRNCGTMPHYEQEVANDPDRALRLQDIDDFTDHFVTTFDASAERAVVTIPVVVHVVYKTSAQNISDALINAQIAQLNADYARTNSDAGNTPSVFQGVSVNTNIQFCLAQRDPNGAATTGIVRRSTTVTSFSDNDAVKSTSSGGDNAWPASSYLNLWVCNLGGGLLGYAQFPGGAASTDGVVVLYSSVGSLSTPGSAVPYNYGRTATHEVGHWLNLRHIWGDASCGNDQVSDTPTQSTSNGGCPSFPHVTCSNGPNGDMFMNYMDYTDDGCMNNLTAGQSARMNALFVSGGSRASIASSLGCQPPTGGTTCNTPSGLAAGSITSSSASISWGATAGAVSYNLQYKLGTATTWSTVNTTSTSYTLSGLTSGTPYNAQVRTVCGGGSSAYSSAITFTTTTTGGGCSDTWESNNTSGTAKTIGVNTDITAAIGSSTDIDWYKFTNSSTASKIKINLTNLPADYDVKLYRGTSTLLGTGQNGGTTSEQLISNTTTVSTYYIRVYGYNGAYSATSCYTLRASTQSANWREIDGGAFPEEVTGDLLNIYPNPTSDKLNVDYLATGDHAVSVDVVDMAGRVVLSSQQAVPNGPSTFGLALGRFDNGLYFLRITDGDQVMQKRFMVQR